MEISEYKGHPLLVLRKNADDKFSMQFGVSKAKLVLANIKDIQKFVAQEESSGKTDSAPPKGVKSAPWKKGSK